MSRNTAYFICAQSGVVPIAMGIPGAAKTALANQFAAVLGCRIYTLIGSIREPADVGGYPTIVEVGGVPVYMNIVPPKWAHDTLNGERWIIHYDELTTCAPAVQAAFLRPMAEGWVGDLKLPRDCIQMATANPVGLAANGFDLEPPMANRLCHLQWEFDWDSWDQGMSNGGEFPLPEFPILPEDWESWIEPTAKLAVAFRKYRPNLFSPPQENGKVTLNRSQLAGAWPSPRSWTNGMRAMAAARSVGAEGTIQHELLKGCVGGGPSDEFAQWLDNLDLPDPEDLIAAAIKGKKIKVPDFDRPDKVIASLSAVCSAVKLDCTEERWRAGLAILCETAKVQMDLALSCVKQFLQLRQKEWRVDQKFIGTMLPAIKRALIDDE